LERLLWFMMAGALQSDCCELKPNVRGFRSVFKGSGVELPWTKGLAHCRALAHRHYRQVLGACCYTSLSVDVRDGSMQDGV
jgi:hypothetical protein